MRRAQSRSHEPRSTELVRTRSVRLISRRRSLQTVTAETDSPITTYYFISDLHIGGDEWLRDVQFESELVGFLERLETTDEDAELIINGDTFGLWEFTEFEGVEKFDVLLERYPELFEQLRATGENIQITIIPGKYLDRARSVFEANPDVAAYVYGHTHRASLRRLDGRAVVNTGTWLKRFTPTAARLGLLPPVFHPSFRLSYYRITAEEGAVIVEYDEVDKANPAELSTLERLVSKRPRRESEIPERTVIEQ